MEELAIDIKGVESSFNGKQLVFAARVVPEPVDANLEDTTWNLWLLDMLTLEPRYVIPSRLKRNDGLEAAGPGHRLHFLPDDRIVFSSTRQVAEQARQLNEGRAQIFAALTEDGRDPAAVLHIYDPQQRDAEFKQISFNRNHDLDPTVLSTGEIVFSRWNRNNGNHISLYQDDTGSGLGLSPLFGFDSEDSGTEGSAIEYTQPRELDDGRIVTLIKSFSSDTLGGVIAIIDPELCLRGPAHLGQSAGASARRRPGAADRHRGAHRRPEVGRRSVRFRLSAAGRHRPLLKTWSECRCIEVPDPVEGGKKLPEEAGRKRSRAKLPTLILGIPKRYSRRAAVRCLGVRRHRRHAAPGGTGRGRFLHHEMIAAEPRDFPSLIPLPDNFNPELALEHKGQIKIDSVYDFDGVDQLPQGIDQHAEPASAGRGRPAWRFLRLRPAGAAAG